MEKLNLSMVECKPYEAIISQKVCDFRKAGAIRSEGQFSRKCLDCPGGIEIEKEEKEMEKGLSLKCKVCGRTAETSEKFFHKSQECKKCYDVRWRREKKAKQEQTETQTSNTTNDTPATLAKAVTGQLPAEKPKNKNNTGRPAHILVLDFTGFPDWYEKLKGEAEKELRTPANMVMYWIKDYVTNSKEEGARNVAIPSK